MTNGVYTARQNASGTRFEPEFRRGSNASDGFVFSGNRSLTNAGVESDSVIGNRLKTVAKMIKGRSQESNKRPIYFVEMNGFDQHANMLPNHRNRMREMNAALKGFRDCLMEQDDYDKVLTYVGSEFARTLTPNGNDPSTSGSDHAWSGHAFAFGDMIDGGKFFGTHPDLALGSGLDVGRGRFIPTNSSSQCSAIVACFLWFVWCLGLG